MKTSEDAVVAKVGRELYELFFRGYTRKQWQRDPSELHASVCARIPIRTNTDDRYFTDTLPEDAAPRATRAMFERMLDHPASRSALATEFDDVRDEVAYDHLVCTGPDRRRSSTTASASCPTARSSSSCATSRRPDGALPAAGRVDQRAELRRPVHADDRVPPHDRAGRTSPRATHVEYPRSEGDPYYPIPNDETRALYKRYEALAAERADVTFVGPPRPLPVPRTWTRSSRQALTTFEKLATRLAAAA